MPSDSERKVYRIRKLVWEQMYNSWSAHTIIGEFTINQPIPGPAFYFSEPDSNAARVWGTLKEAKIDAEQTYRQQLRKALTEVKP